MKQRPKEILSMDFITTVKKYGTSCHISLPAQWNEKKVFVSVKVIENDVYDNLVNNKKEEK